MNFFLEHLLYTAVSLFLVIGGMYMFLRFLDSTLHLERGKTRLPYPLELYVVNKLEPDLVDPCDFKREVNQVSRCTTLNITDRTTGDTVVLNCHHDLGETCVLLMKYDNRVHHVDFTLCPRSTQSAIKQFVLSGNLPLDILESLFVVKKTKDGHLRAHFPKGSIVV